MSAINSGNSYPFPFVGPIAPETNPVIEPLWYQPSNFTITAITKGLQTTVTITSSTSAPSKVNFYVGQQVRFNIPVTYGIQELNGQTGFVTSLPASNQFVVNINSQGYSNFVPSPAYGPTPPQVAAIGDINTGTINPGRATTGTFIDGSFINVSPIGTPLTSEL